VETYQSHRASPGSALTPANQARTRFACPGGIESWVNLGD